MQTTRTKETSAGLPAGHYLKCANENRRPSGALCARLGVWTPLNKVKDERKGKDIELSIPDPLLRLPREPVVHPGGMGPILVGPVCDHPSRS